jgi:hypothetical protein
MGVDFKTFLMNCSPCCSFSTGPAVAMVTGFGYAFLGAALLTRIGLSLRLYSDKKDVVKPEKS